MTNNDKINLKEKSLLDLIILLFEIIFQLLLRLGKIIFNVIDKFFKLVGKKLEERSAKSKPKIVNKK